MPDLLIISVSVLFTLFLIATAVRLVRTIEHMAVDIREVRDEVRRLSDRSGPAGVA